MCECACVCACEFVCVSVCACECVHASVCVCVCACALRVTGREQSKGTPLGPPVSLEGREAGSPAMVGDGRGRQRAGPTDGHGPGHGPGDATGLTPLHPTPRAIFALDSRISRKMCKSTRGGATLGAGPGPRGGAPGGTTPRGVATGLGAWLAIWEWSHCLRARDCSRVGVALPWGVTKTGGRGSCRGGAVSGRS